MSDETESTRTLGLNTRAADGSLSPGDSIRPRATDPLLVSRTSLDKTILPMTWDVERVDPTVALPGLKPVPLPFDEVPASSSFHLRRVVGRGGYGEVWEALQSSLGRIVAVKRIRRDRDDSSIKDDQFEVRVIESEFRQEAVTTAVLDHPNIVPVYDLGVDSTGSPLLAMKLVRGKSWNELIREDASLPIADMLGKHLPILRQVAQAVAFAHSKGVIHRDLKPAQVMVGEFGEVILMDWGLAVSFREEPFAPKSGEVPILTPSNAATPHRFASNPAGTPSFMAPEQTLKSGEFLGPWTDVFLLGGVLYYLLTLTPPNAGGTVTVVMERAGEGTVERASKRAPRRGIPPELEELCERAMKREPGERIASAEEFIQGIDDYITGSGRRREAARLHDEARAMLGSVDAANEETLIRAFRPLEEALSRWPDHDGARELLSAAKLRLVHVRAKAARRRRNGLAAFAVVVAALSSLSIWLQARNAAAEERFAAQERASLRLEESAALRSRENRLAERIVTLLPLPDQLLPDPPESAFLAANRPRINTLAQERASVRTERLRLLGDGVRLDPEPFPLQLGEANLLVREGGSLAKALEAYRLYQTASGLQPDFAEAHVGMGIAAARAGQFTSATMHLERAVELTREALGENHPRYAAVLALAGDSYRNLDDSGEAFRTYYRKSLDVLEPQWAALSLSIAARWRSLAEPAIAMEYTSQTLAMATRRGAGAEAIQSDAILAASRGEEALGDYASARPNAERALELRRQLFGEADSRTREAQRHLALVLMDQGEYETAVAELRSIIATIPTAEDIRDSDSVETQRMLATALHYAGRSEEALPIALEAVKNLESLLGKESRQTSIAYSDVATILDDLRRYNEARDWYIKAHETAVAILGEEHPEVATTYNNLGYNMQMQGRYAEAIPYFRKALDIRRARQGDEHPDTATCFNNLGTAYLGAEQFAPALDNIARGFVVLRKSLGPDHPSTASLMNNLAICLSRMGREQDAFALQAATHRVMFSALGAGHPLLVDIQRNLIETWVLSRKEGTAADGIMAIRWATEIENAYAAQATFTALRARRDVAFLESMKAWGCERQAAPPKPEIAALVARIRAFHAIAKSPASADGDAKSFAILAARHGANWDNSPLSDMPEELWPDRTAPIDTQKLFDAIEAAAPAPDLVPITGNQPFDLSEVLPTKEENEAEVERILEGILHVEEPAK